MHWSILFHMKELKMNSVYRDRKQDTLDRWCLVKAVMKYLNFSCIWMPMKEHWSLRHLAWHKGVVLHHEFIKNVLDALVFNGGLLVSTGLTTTCHILLWETGRPSCWTPRWSMQEMTPFCPNCTSNSPTIFTSSESWIQCVDFYIFIQTEKKNWK